MLDLEFRTSGASQIAADNRIVDHTTMPIPDPVCLELRMYESEIVPLVEELMEHHWVEGKIKDGWAITPLVVRRAFIAQLKALFNDMTADWGADDAFHGDFGTALQGEILEMVDKVST